MVVPNYNHALCLQQRLNSIINQEFQNLKVIILDDASTDHSREIIQPYSRYPALRFLLTKPAADPYSSNVRKGLESARGGFAESDDCASPYFLSKLLPILKNDRSLALQKYYAGLSRHFTESAD